MLPFGSRSACDAARHTLHMQAALAAALQDLQRLLPEPVPAVAAAPDVRPRPHMPAHAHAPARRASPLQAPQQLPAPPAFMATVGEQAPAAHAQHHVPAPAAHRAAPAPATPTAVTAQVPIANSGSPLGQQPQRPNFELHSHAPQPSLSSYPSSSTISPRTRMAAAPNPHALLLPPPWQQPQPQHERLQGQRLLDLLDGLAVPETVPASAATPGATGHGSAGATADAECLPPPPAWAMQSAKPSLPQGDGRAAFGGKAGVSPTAQSGLPSLPQVTTPPAHPQRPNPTLKPSTQAAPVPPCGSTLRAESTPALATGWTWSAAQQGLEKAPLDPFCVSEGWAVAGAAVASLCLEVSCCLSPVFAVCALIPLRCLGTCMV